jgi:hypothetical protein
VYIWGRLDRAVENSGRCQRGRQAQFKGIAVGIKVLHESWLLADEAMTINGCELVVDH